MGNSLTAGSVGSLAEKSDCEEAEKEVNQAAMAKTRRLERQKSRSGRHRASASTGRADMGVIGALRRPMQRIRQYIGEVGWLPIRSESSLLLLNSTLLLLICSGVSDKETVSSGAY